MDIFFKLIYINHIFLENHMNITLLHYTIIIQNNNRYIYNKIIFICVDLLYNILYMIFYYGNFHLKSN